jgi:hypothetical protein
MGQGMLGRVGVGSAVLGAIVGVAAVGACSSSRPAPAPAVSTSATTSTSTSRTTSASPTSTSRSTTSSGSSTSGSTTAAGTVCRAGTGKVTVVPSAGGAAAGHVQLEVRVTNTGSSPCTLRGYPGVSLVTGTEGAQLGAPAQRTPGPEGLVTLAPGAKAVALVQLAQASNFPNCGVTPAAGFRVYLPDDTAAQFAPLVEQGCSSTSVVLLEVAPFTTA